MFQRDVFILRSLNVTIMLPTTPLLPQSTCEDSCTDHKCSEEFETWGNPENIATYYECSFNCACLINCPLGLVYDSNAAYCKEPDCSTQPESPACSAIPINSKVVRNVQIHPQLHAHGISSFVLENGLVNSLVIMDTSMMKKKRVALGQ
ncbi:unnamed protein product [Lepeophtheirus salmonis]|uniref:(salmon louse) hypothetical protein n=1 Tax=Lepeophtheirus salmonis TaxID=72036 RepID=A0A7R8H7Y9_LEPSM|nr:unnamed protein product [Lepeophtheirus salmonis]CAF2927910.1 unnamed protein product [Lepeophtheirus salmonis]